MTPEQQQHLQAAHTRLLRAVTDYFNASDRSRQYPYNAEYKRDVSNKRIRLRRLAKEENLERSKSSEELTFRK